MAVLQVNRQEIKYPISMLEYKKLEGKLSACLRRDPYTGPYGYYKVRSLYFDTPFEDDREAVLRGGQKRHKIRLRVYSPHDKVAKLEMKAKEGSIQKKISVIVSREEAQQLIAGDFSCLRDKDSPEAEHLRLAMERGMYRPRVMVEYKRSVHYLPARDIRITFDYDAVASRTNFDLFSDSICWTPLRPASVGVLEVKFNQFLFSYVQTLLEGVEKLPSANGKYIYACNI